MAAFFLIAFTIITIAYSFVGWRLIAPAGLGLVWNLFFSSIVFLFLLLPFVSFFARINGYRIFDSQHMQWFLYLSMGCMSTIFTLLLLRDGAWIVLFLIKKLTFILPGIPEILRSVPSLILDHLRMSENSVNLALLGLTALLMTYGFHEARRIPQTVQVDIPVHNLPESLRGFRIVQITDLHVSPTIRRSFVQAVTDRVNGMRPDMIVFTGDLADGPVDELRSEVAPLSGLSAPYGKYFITGNHEYYSGVEAWLAEVQRLGFDPLINEHRIIERNGGRLLLAGVTDYSDGHFLPGHISSPRNAVAGAPACDARILLAHQPRSVFDAEGLGFNFVISGHTHGGQFFPWIYFVTLQQPFVAGLYPNNGTPVYVSRGTGYWGPPLRIGSPSEITVFTLRDAENSKD